MTKSASKLRVLARAIRQHWYPIPVLNNRYVRRAGARFGSRFNGPVRCLDLGSGVAPYRKLVEAGFGAGFYISCDIAPSEQTNLVSNAARLPVRDGSVQLVVIMETLQHIADAGRVLSEIRRVLAPGGLVILSFPFTFAECDVEDFHRWSMAGMADELRRSDLEVIDARRRGGALFTAVCMLHWAVQHAVPGARKSWRAPATPTAAARAALLLVLTAPTALAGWIALALDAVLPMRGLYMGGLMVARRGA